ncbi:hypothetical protein [Paraburkholderia caribensis]|uniref:hypothetical protein n=1 Tax=Paraburkholderia caribensis TaxID=75105 RepID=UPI00071FFF10|nr:hypothetical protein [Paraburkholderia caribensis]ALP67129.1 hypothetical protein AN416_30985 [Paraburkholderia caribensis]AUT56836.1 hypothetical protein C2L66_33955 [Paraburkholderia caribensis]
MNWLTEYFAQGTRTLNLSLWAYSPAVMGPDGPIVQPAALCAPYPGIELVFSPAGKTRHGDRTYELPARYDSTGPMKAKTAAAAKDHANFFREVSIFAPSHLNGEAVVVINHAFSFTPRFAADGTPGFVGLAMPDSDDYFRAGQMKLPWMFAGYVSI